MTSLRTGRASHTAHVTSKLGWVDTSGDEVDDEIGDENDDDHSGEIDDQIGNDDERKNCQNLATEFGSCSFQARWGQAPGIMRNMLKMVMRLTMRMTMRMIIIVVSLFSLRMILMIDCENEVL